MVQQPKGREKALLNINLVPPNPKEPFPSIGKLFVLRGNKTKGLTKRIYTACEQLSNMATAVSQRGHPRLRFIG